MAQRTPFPTGKAILIGGALATAYYLLTRSPSKAAEEEPTGTPGGKDELGLGGEGPYEIVVNNYLNGTDREAPSRMPEQTFVTEAPIIDNSLSPDRITTAYTPKQVGLEPNFSSGLFGEVNVTAGGFIPVTDDAGMVIGGYDLKNQQSIMFTNMSYEPGSNLGSKSGAPVASTPTGVLGTGITAPQFGLLGLGFAGSYGTALGSEAVKPSSTAPLAKRVFQSGVEDAPFGKQIAGSLASEGSQAVGKEVVKETTKIGAKQALKTGAKIGVSAIPLIGTVAGAEFDVAVDNRPRALAYGANILGDVLGGVGGAFGSAVGPAGTVGGAIGGQILGEQLVYKPFDWFFKKDEKDDEESQISTQQFSNVQQPLYSSPGDNLISRSSNSSKVAAASAAAATSVQVQKKSSGGSSSKNTITVQAPKSTDKMVGSNVTYGQALKTAEQMKASGMNNAQIVNAMVAQNSKSSSSSSSKSSSSSSSSKSSSSPSTKPSVSNKNVGKPVAKKDSIAKKKGYIK